MSSRLSTKSEDKGDSSAMYPQRSHIEAMFLSPQEAMDLLDLCVISQAEVDPDKERVILKLTEYVRNCIQDEQNARFKVACA